MRWAKRILRILLLLLMLAVAGALLIDTDMGHRFLVDRIAAQAPKSGLRIQIGRIDGSIYDKAEIRQLTLSDPQGAFFTVPLATLDWNPFQWWNNRLDIEKLMAETGTLTRLPKLRASDEKRPILPGFDIHVGAVAIKKLTIRPAITGQSRTGALSGKIEVHEGRALIDLTVDAAQGDVLTLKLDAAPDRNIFDLDAHLKAPAGGVFGQVIGTGQAVSLTAQGDGSWQNWQGSGSASFAGAPIADLSLSAKNGQFALGGRLMLDSITHGKVQRLTGPVTQVQGTATLANRRLAGSLSLRSAAIASRSFGALDLAGNRFDPINIDAQLLQPAALFPAMTGENIQLKARLFGEFKSAAFDYALTAPRIAFNQTGFETVRASGQGRFMPSPVIVPITLSAARVTGVGDVGGGILANLKVAGKLLVTGKSINGDGLLLKSDKLSGKLALFVDLKTGLYDVGLAGQLVQYLIPGLGLVDVKSELSVVPGPGGGPAQVTGKGQAWVRRFDNGFLASLAGGLPVLETALSRDADGVLHFTNLRLSAPGLTLSGTGLRRRDGSFQFEGSGKQARYGPLTLALDGPIARPKLNIMLARPNDALGLANVHLLLDPNLDGYAWRAEGRSKIGPFTGQGGLLLPKGATAIVDVASLNASGVNATGRLAVLAGGLEGRMTIAGSGVDGTLDFAPARGVQQIAANVRARGARLAGPPLIAAQSGSFVGTIRLDPTAANIEGTVVGQGLQYGAVSLAKLAANVRLNGGVGEVRASFAGSRGRAFDLQTVAQVRPDRWQVIGQGTIDRRPVALTSPAIVTREADGWRLAPTALSFGGGEARVAGLFGEAATDMNASITRMPLSILEIARPGLGLGGTATGTLAYRLPTNGAPSGKADLRITGLTRSGLVVSSRPVDMGIAAVLGGDSAGIRAIAMSGGKELGRAQARLIPTNSGGLFDRLANAQVTAQVRYSGSADTLWRLTGVQSFDVSGPVALGADVSGRVDQPLIRGSLRTENARIESAVTGLVLTGVKASGRFGGGSRLMLDSFSAQAGKDGSISGSGSFDLAAPNGLGIDLAIETRNAAVLARDDLGATVTGPMRIQSDGNGGLISGDLTLDRSRYRLGRSTAAQAVPHLNVREINVPNDAISLARAASPWQLAIKARAANRVIVTGLGLNSEWRTTVELSGSALSPVLNGRADLLRGDYEFAGRRFAVSKGSIRFQGENPPDPIIDITAEGDTQGLSAAIRVTGTGQKPDIRFTSNPTLPEDELLSRLLFGTSITNLSAPEAVQLGAAVASLRNGGNGLNPINALRNAIGLDRLRILPADTVTGQKTAIAAGKYLSRRAFVEIVTDGQGYSATRAEFQVTRWLSILSSISTIGRQSASVRVSKDY